MLLGNGVSIVLFVDRALNRPARALGTDPLTNIFVLFRQKREHLCRECSSNCPDWLLRLQDLLGLLELRKFALLPGEFLAHLGNFLFLLADLFKDDLDRSLLDPRPAAGGGC